jgi:hypothetical protein
MRDIYKRKTLLDLIVELDKKLKVKTSLNKKDLKDIIRLIFGELGLPLPSSDIIEYFAKSGLVGELILDAHNSDYLEIDDRIKIKEEFLNLYNHFKIKRTGEELRYRILGNQGTYPISEIKRDKTWYSNYGSRPSLITVNRIESEDQFKNGSWLYWVSRRELKFATSMILTSKYNNIFPYFNPFDTISLNYSDIKDVPELKLFEFLNHWMDIKNFFIKPDSQIFNREPRPDLSTYQYDKFNAEEQGFNTIFDSFSIRNHLLMRTSNYLLKGLMNHVNQLFQEEALLNVFLALEGSLHLLQKKYGDNSPRLNRDLLRSVFKNEISYLPSGEGTFDFIEEGYSTRISLVHPEPKWGTEWNPYVHPSDFREYFGLAKLILNWTLAEREIDLI